MQRAVIVAIILLTGIAINKQLLRYHSDFLLQNKFIDISSHYLNRILLLTFENILFSKIPASN